MYTVGAKAGTSGRSVSTADSTNPQGGNVAGQRRSEIDWGNLSPLGTTRMAGTPRHSISPAAFSTVADGRRLYRTHRASRWETPAALPSGFERLIP